MNAPARPDSFAAPAHHARAARIGPNAILRVDEALVAREGAAVRDRIFARARLSHYVSEPPVGMVDEREVAALHAALVDDLPPDASRAVAILAGRLTGDYLLANRIPKPIQAILKVLPATLAARILVRAIKGHAWTFCGSGTFEATFGAPLVLTIADNPVCRGRAVAEPACDYFAATFERLFRALVSPRARVMETECLAAGGSLCRFTVDWSAPVA
jgi:divinyl protochlorophyllide a 8-vinyl-reductase